MLQNNMKYYQEITLLPSQEINLNFLMGKVFNSLHLYFVENQIEGIVRIGISFPEYNLENNTLGTKIRLFFDSIESCEKMNLKEYLNAFDDYIHVTKRRDIPRNVKYAMFKRFQIKGSKYKLVNRCAKRKNISFEEALKLYDKYNKQNCKLPYIPLKSSSNGYKYNLFIKKIDLQEENVTFNTYNTFGLSNNSSVPIF